MSERPFTRFDNVFVISHPMTERLQGMLERVSEVGVDWALPIFAERPTIAPTNMRRDGLGELGCAMSHVKAWVAAQDSDGSNLFLEDDVHFVPNAETVLLDALDALPAHWSVLYLGGHPCEDVTRVSEHLVKVGRFSFAEAYAVRSHRLTQLLSYWCDRMGRPDAMIDRILGEFAEMTNGYAVYPPITYQPAGHSFVTGASDDKTHCVDSGWQNHLKG